MGRNSIVNDENPIWRHLGRIVHIKNTRVWETQDRIGIVWPGDSSEESRTWLSQIEDDGEMKYRARFKKQEFGDRKRKLWKKRRGQESGDKTAWTELSEIVGNGKPTGSVLKEKIAVSVTMLMSVQNWHSRTSLRALLCGRMRDMHREPEVREAKVPAEECFDCHARIIPQRNLHQFILWKVAPSRMLVLQDQEWLQIWEKCSYAHRQVEEQPSKRSKKNGDKSAVAMLKKHESYDRTEKLVVCRDTSHERHGPVVCNLSNTRQLGCVFQDMEPPKSLSILRKSSNIRKPIRCVEFTKAVVRHADIRDQNPSLGMICPGDPHQRNPNAPKIEDRSQEETEWQERCAREAAWRLAKSILKNKGEK